MNSYSEKAVDMPSGKKSPWCKDYEWSLLEVGTEATTNPGSMDFDSPRSNVQLISNSSKEARIAEAHRTVEQSLVSFSSFFPNVSVID